MLFHFLHPFVIRQTSRFLRRLLVLGRKIDKTPQIQTIPGGTLLAKLIPLFVNFFECPILTGVFPIQIEGSFFRSLQNILGIFNKLRSLTLQAFEGGAVEGIVFREHI